MGATPRGLPPTDDPGRDGGRDDSAPARRPDTPARLARSGAAPATLRVNGVERPVPRDPRVTLLDALRDHWGLTGAKKGCDRGECGACTVLVDGRRVNSCLTLAVMHDGAEITTVEGLARDGVPHPVQEAFVEHDAPQCGFCTPGQILSAVALLAEGRATSDVEIREWMSGNLCRCAAYPNIVAAIRQVASAEGPPPTTGGAAA